MRLFPKLTVTVGALALALTASLSASADPIEYRQALMKDVGAATGMAAAMVKGEAEFEPRVAHLVFRVMNAGAAGYAELFPEGTETGGDTEAAPAIWSDRAGFEAAAAKFFTDTSEVLKAPPQDLDQLRTAFGMVTKNCGACHETYRVKKN